MLSHINIDNFNQSDNWRYGFYIYEINNYYNYIDIILDFHKECYRYQD